MSSHCAEEAGGFCDIEPPVHGQTVARIPEILSSVHPLLGDESFKLESTVFVVVSMKTRFHGGKLRIPGKPSASV